MNRFPVALILGALSLPALAGPQRAVVEAQLDGIEQPPTAKSLKAIPGVVDELLEIAQDSDASRTHRAKAVHALGHFPQAETRAVLESALLGDDAKLARGAAYALGNGWGDAAVPTLRSALASTDTQLRIAAAASLGNVGSAQARVALDQRLAIESVPAVRESIQASITRTGDR